MTDYGITGVLALVTLGIVLLVAVVYFIWFQRKPENRHPMDSPAGHVADDERREAVLHAREEDPSLDPEGASPNRTT